MISLMRHTNENRVPRSCTLIKACTDGRLAVIKLESIESGFNLIFVCVYFQLCHLCSSINPKSEPSGQIKYCHTCSLDFFSHLPQSRKTPQCVIDIVENWDIRNTGWPLMTGAGLPVAVPSPGVPTSLATTSVRKGGGGAALPHLCKKSGEMSHSGELWS